MAGVEAPLRPNAALDDAARHLARGETLEEAVAGAGYRVKRSTFLQIRTDKGDARVAEILVQQFCEDVTEPAFQEIGVFRRGNETWFVLAQPFSPPGAADAPAVTRRVLELVNEARAQARRCGRKKFPAASPLGYSAVLERAALAHAQDMAAHGYMGHEGRDGSKPSDRVSRAGYDWRSVAENVAAGQTSAEEVVKTWLASSSHCASLMDGRYTETGVAYAVEPASERGIYWAQVFGRPR